MTSAELRAAFDQMTVTPWRIDTDASEIACGTYGSGERDTIVTLGPNCGGNETAIVALANHAGPLVELLAAVERWRAADISPVDHVSYYEQRFAAQRALRDALARVHEVTP